MSKLYEFFYMNKKKIIISVICLFVIVIGLMSFYFINYKYNNHVKKEIISEEIEFCYKVPKNGFVKIKELGTLVETETMSIEREQIAF